MRAAPLLAALLLLDAAPATAQGLTVAFAAPVTSLDPHFQNAAPNNAVAMHVFDRLVERDPESSIVAGLATEWAPRGTDAWAFRLRPNVTFHDGTPFTADDVAFTVARVRGMTNAVVSFTQYLRAVTAVEVEGPDRVILRTPGPSPYLLSDLASLHILSRRTGEGATTADYDAGRATVGTGPYRLTAFRTGERVELARHDGAWHPRGPWQAVTIRLILTDASRSAALLSGDVDVIEQVPSQDLERLRREPRVTVAEGPGLRTLFLQPNAALTEPGATVTDADGRPLTTNPLLDPRVRRALSLALPREALAERVMEGTARATAQWTPPGSAGHLPDHPVRPADPAAAQALLAEAGYPRGFRLRLTSPNDRYPNDARLAQAIGAAWTRIGVRTEVDAIPWSVFSGRTARGEFGLALNGLGNAQRDALPFLTNVLASPGPGRGTFNRGRHADPALDALVARALTTLDDAARTGITAEAARRALDGQAVIPLLLLDNIWAARRGLTVTPRLDERTLAMSVAPAP